jgi:DNA repair protein RadC
MNAQQKYNPVMRLIRGGEIAPLPTINTAKDCELAFRNIWDTRFLAKQERVYVMFLNQKCEIVRHELLNAGTANQTHFDMSLAIDIAREEKSKWLIIGHNHPSGHVLPSDGDIELTKYFSRMLNDMGITLIDHIIIGGTQINGQDSYYSFGEHKLLN